jgi:hypothetical protein
LLSRCPKITIPEQAAALADLFDPFGKAKWNPRGLPEEEMMIETTQSIINAQAKSICRCCSQPLAGVVSRRTSALTTTRQAAALTAAHQHMMHPACDFAKHMMQVSFRRFRRLAFGCAN